MDWTGKVLVFLVISLFTMLAYFGFNAFVTNHAEEVVSRAPKLPETGMAEMVEQRCRAAEDRYEALINDPPADGNSQRRELDIEIALAQIDRVCS